MLPAIGSPVSRMRERSAVAERNCRRLPSGGIDHGHDTRIRGGNRRALCTGVACAQDYPSRPIKLLVPIPPGGAPDIVARVIGLKLSEAFGQQVVVENRTGSNGNIAAEATAKAAPDGHTLMLCADAQIVINPHLYKRMPFDPLKDLSVIATVVSNEFVLAVNPALPVKDIPGVHRVRAQSQPAAQLRLGRQRQPAPSDDGDAESARQHQPRARPLQGRHTCRRRHCRRRGGGGICRRFQRAADQGRSAARDRRRGRRAFKLFPELPTIGEFYPGFRNSIWLALCAPAGMPEAIVGRLRTEVNKVLAQPDMKERFSNAGGVEPFITTPAELAALIQSDYAKYGKVVKDIGAVVD